MSRAETTYGPCPDGAAILAEQAGYQYLAVEWVYRRPPGGQIEYYATRAAWADTPAAQLAAKDIEIASLQARIAELEQRLRATPISAPPPIRIWRSAASTAAWSKSQAGGRSTRTGAGIIARRGRQRKRKRRRRSARPPCQSRSMVTGAALTANRTPTRRIYMIRHAACAAWPSARRTAMESMPE